MSGSPHARVPVVDMWAPIVPSAEIIADLQSGFPVEQLQYLEIFTHRSVTAQQFASYAETLLQSDEQILAALDDAGIMWSLISGFDERSTCGVRFVSNEAVAAIAARHPSRFVAFAGADIMRGTAALAELEMWVSEHGFCGLSLRPFMIGEPATHRAYFPFYAKCVELGVPLSIHTSANWTRSRPSELGHPRFIDEVACHFPDLTIIMSHAGYPWVLEACLIAWKHPNVYLELGAHRPKYLATPGSGWDALMRFGQSTMAEKVLYGTGAFLINRPYGDLCEEARQLPVRDDLLEGWLWRNASRLLGLDTTGR
jgi:uncharacterized protein